MRRHSDLRISQTRSLHCALQKQEKKKKQNKLLRKRTLKRTLTPTFVSSDFFLILKKIIQKLAKNLTISDQFSLPLSIRTLTRILLDYFSQKSLHSSKILSFDFDAFARSHPPTLNLTRSLGHSLARVRSRSILG